MKNTSTPTAETVTLQTPVKHGEQIIDSVTLRKPASGELRGLKLMDLVQMDVGAVITVLPRISSPALTEQDCSAMNPADLMQCAVKVSGFLLPTETPTDTFPQA